MRLSPLAVAAAAALACAGLAAAGRLALSEEAGRPLAARDPAWLPSGRVLRATAFGQRLLLSDLYWLRTVQYMGETLLAKADRWDALYPLADIVTDLDPRHGYAYQVVGSNLAGLAGRYDQADAILQKGMRAVPDRWSLPFTYASNKFLFQGDYAEAAAYARRAAEIGKRPHLALLAANLSALADTDGEYQAALAFLDETLAQTSPAEEILVADLLERRTRVETFQVLSRVEKAVAAFEREAGRRPRALADLVPRHLPAVPDDPAGGRILYDPATGEVRSTVLGPRAPLRITR
jgi:hypothetical protein